MGRSFVSTDHGTIGQLGDGVEYWRGYFQSLRLTQMGLSLNIGISHYILYNLMLLIFYIMQA